MFGSWLGKWVGSWFGKTSSAPVETRSPSYPSNSGLADEGVNGRVWRDNAWVKARKVVIRGLPVQYAQKSAAQASVCCVVKSVSARRFVGAVAANSQTRATARCASATPVNAGYRAVSKTETSVGNIRISGYNCFSETLGMDEILALVEMAA